MIILIDSRFWGVGAGEEWYGKEYYLLRRKFRTKILLESTTVLIFAFVATC